MTFDYSKLNGRIKEIFNTQENFAKSIGVSTTSINYKLNNRTYFTQEEISKAIKVLNILPEEICSYFFNQKV